MNNKKFEAIWRSMSPQQIVIAVMYAALANHLKLRSKKKAPAADKTLVEQIISGIEVRMMQLRYEYAGREAPNTMTAGDIPPPPPPPPPPPIWP